MARALLLMIQTVAGKVGALMFQVGSPVRSRNDEFPGQDASARLTIGILAGTFGTLMLGVRTPVPNRSFCGSRPLYVINASSSTLLAAVSEDMNHRRSPDLYLASRVLLCLFFLLFLTPVHSGGAMSLRKAAEEWLPCPTRAKDPSACCQLHLNPLFLAG